MEHTFKFTNMDCLIISDALNYLIKDEERHAIDRKSAKLIKDEISKTVEKDYSYRIQGEWIKICSLENGNARYECSNCWHSDEQAESQEVPYCWNCGAKMKKKESKQ